MGLAFVFLVSLIFFLLFYKDYKKIKELERKGEECKEFDDIQIDGIKSTIYPAVFLMIYATINFIVYLFKLIF
jgi:hypothetical protein